jgi:hypothetical protein
MNFFFFLKKKIISEKPIGGDLFEEYWENFKV